MGGRHLPRSLDGKVLRPGMIVRVTRIPDLTGMRPTQRSQSAAVFRHIEGTYRRITGFDSLGFAEIMFRIRKGRNRGIHVVGIEPTYLRIPTRRKSTKSKE